VTVGTPTLTVGVLGGMGPEATLDFFAELLSATPAARDQDRLRVLIDNNPKVPNRNEAVAGTGPSPAPLLAEMARGLQRSGADFLVMPCNAAHAFAREIEKAVDIPFVSIIEETVAATVRRVPGLTRVGVLAAAGTLDARLYHSAFALHDVSVAEPDSAQREAFMELLYRIKTGDLGEEVRNRMARLAQELLEGGSQAIVAGCTEVPLVLRDGDLACPLVSSTNALVAATVAYATGARRLPARSGQG
jgi:aspartate racemase